MRLLTSRLLTPRHVAALSAAVALAFAFQAAEAAPGQGRGPGNGPGNGPGVNGDRGQRDPAAMARQMIERFDKNGDQALNAEELAAMMTEMRERRGPDGPGQGQGQGGPGAGPRERGAGGPQNGGPGQVRRGPGPRPGGQQ